MSRDAATDSAQARQSKWKELAAGSFAHFIHDGFTDMIYVFFPLWQAQWALTFAEVGLLKMLVSGSMAMFQLPAGMIANRVGPEKLLLAGTFITSLAVMFWGFSISPAILGLLLIAGGLGSSVQHPVSSSIISDAYSDIKARRIALSTYNVAGDLGKLVLPGSAAFLIAYCGWQTTSRWLSIFGLLATLILCIGLWGLRVHDSDSPPEKRPMSAKGLLLGWKGYQAFWSMTMIGVLDSATRMGFLTFFPFLLQEKGATVPQIGFALTLIFAGGATGKLVCGILATRLGILRSVVVTESVTALCIGGMIGLPLGSALLLAPFLGIALNGTSSMLYGSVPELVAEEQRKQGFSIFYTMTLGAGAISPAIYGALSDFMGLKMTVVAVAIVVLGAIPLSWPLRGKLGN